MHFLKSDFSQAVLIASGRPTGAHRFRGETHEQLRILVQTSDLLVASSRHDPQAPVDRSTRGTHALQPLTCASLISRVLRPCPAACALCSVVTAQLGAARLGDVFLSCSLFRVVTHSNHAASIATSLLAFSFSFPSPCDLCVALRCFVTVTASASAHAYTVLVRVQYAVSRTRALLGAQYAFFSVYRTR